MSKGAHNLLAFFIINILFVLLSPVVLFSLGNGNAKQVDSSSLPYAEPGCLAQGCHAEMAPRTEQVAHEPFARGQCQTCHTISQAHRNGDVTGLQSHEASLKDIEMCSSCHERAESGYNHPVGRMIDPVTGGLLTCTSTCHDPHASAYPMLLRYPNNDRLCLNCHFENG